MIHVYIWNTFKYTHLIQRGIIAATVCKYGCGTAHAPAPSAASPRARKRRIPFPRLGCGFLYATVCV